MPIYGLLEAEYILKFGKTLKLHITHVDPRDFWRGDYINLGYIYPTPSLPSNYRGDIFLNLKERSDEIYEFTNISTKMPNDRHFIRCSIDRFYDTMCGINKFFTKSQDAREIENSSHNEGNKYAIISLIDGKVKIKALQIGDKIFE